MADNDNDAPQVYLLGKTYLANNQGQFYIKNDPIVHMAAGDRHTIIITETGRAFAFGDNTSGQLGLGHTDKVEKVSCIKSLKFGDSGERVMLAACGRESSLVATNHGHLYSFGSDGSSQLGFESSDPNLNEPSPKKIEHFKGKTVWKQIAMGAEHACALTDDGIVYIWGNNDDGQCAQPGKVKTVSVPRELRLEYQVSALSCGNYHTALVSEDGRLFVFGNNDNRQLGRSLPDKFAGPIEVSMPHKVKDVACGHQHTIVLTTTGEVYASGLNDRGQLGLGPGVSNAESFELVHGLPKRVTAIAAGEGHTAVLGTRGDLYVFGDGKHGKLGPQTHSNEFEPFLVDKFKTYNVQKVVCGGCQTIVLAQKRDQTQKKSSGSEEDIGNATLSVTQRPKSRARNNRHQTGTGRSLTVGDSMDTTLKQERPLGAANHLRVESDDDKSEKELSESLKSATFNQTHTLTNGRFRPTQSPSLNRTTVRANDDDSKLLRTGALDRTARLHRDTDELNKTNNRLPALERPPVRNVQLERSSPPTVRKGSESNDDKSSAEEEKPLPKKPQRLSPPLRTEPRRSPVPRPRNDSESDDNKHKQPSPRPKIPVSESLNRKVRQPTRSEDEESDDSKDEEEEEDDNPKSSSRRTKLPPPTAVRRNSLPQQTRSGVSNSSGRDGNQTIGAKPSDNTRGSFRAPATKTLAKTTTTATNADTPKKETPPAAQPGFFSRLFGPKSAPPPPPPPPPAATAANPSSRACSIM